MTLKPLEESNGSKILPSTRNQWITIVLPIKYDERMEERTVQENDQYQKNHFCDVAIQHISLLDRMSSKC